MGDGGDMEQEIGRATEGGVDEHGVFEGGGCEDVGEGRAGGFHIEQRQCRAAGVIAPDGLAGGHQRRMGQRQAESFGDDLGGGRGAEKLTAAAGRAASLAAHFRGVIEADQAVGEAGADGLDGAGIFGAFGWQGDAAGHDDAGQVAAAGESDHRGGEAFVTGGDTHDAVAGGQGADHAAHDDGGVVAIGEAVHHAGGALGAAIAGVGAIDGEGDGVVGADGLGGFLDEEADFPVAGVVAEGDRAAVFGAQAAFGADDDVLFAVDFFRVPAHGDILGHGEEVAAGFVEQHVFVEGEFAFASLPAGAGGREEVGTAVDFVFHVTHSC